MTSINIITLYLQLNFALITSYVVFVTAKTLVERRVRRFSFASLRKSAQMTLVFSLVAVPFLYLLPHRELTSVSNSPVFKTEIAESLERSPIAASQFNAQEPLRLTPEENIAIKDVVFDYLSSLDEEQIATAALLSLLVGFLVVSARKVRAYYRLAALVNSAQPIRKFGKVSVVVSDHIAIPFSAIVKRTCYVALPSSVLSQGQDFKVALFHEIQHHRQRDTRWILLFEFLVSLFYLNPIVYRWKKELTDLQELSCDEALIGHRKVSARAYGECLVRVAEAALHAQVQHVGTACLMMDIECPHFKSLLGRRVQMLAQNGNALVKKWYSILFLGSVIGCSVTLAYAAQLPVKSSKSSSGINPGKVKWNAEVQAIAESELKVGMKKSGATSGFIIVAEPNTGRILANANIDLKNSLQDSENWSLSTLYEPASVFKGLVVAAALEDESTTSTEVHNCENGVYKSGSDTFRDWKPFDKLTSAESVIYSSTICAIKVAEKMNSEDMTTALENFGFGKDGSASKFPEARSSEIPSFENFLPFTAMGMGFYVTPLEVVQAYGAIANGGVLMKPQPYQKSDSSGVTVRRVLSQETAREMRSILARTVTSGTSINARSKLYTMAGKTGSGSSGQEPEHLLKSNDINTANFIGFAPANDPKIEVYVVLNGPKPIAGGRYAAPVFRKVAERVLERMGVESEE